MSQSTREFLALSVAGNSATLKLSPDQRKTIQQRIHDHDQNPDTAISWEQIRSELFLSKQ